MCEGGYGRRRVDRGGEVRPSLAASGLTGVALVSSDAKRMASSGGGREGGAERGLHYHGESPRCWKQLSSTSRSPPRPWSVLTNRSVAAEHDRYRRSEATAPGP